MIDSTLDFGKNSKVSAPRVEAGREADLDGEVVLHPTEDVMALPLPNGRGRAVLLEGGGVEEPAYRVAILIQDYCRVGPDLAFLPDAGLYGMPYRTPDYPTIAGYPARPYI